MRLARVVVLSTLACLALVPAAASAQDKGDFGLTMGAPLSIGFISHISDRFALRPEIQLRASTTETESTFSGIEADSLDFSVGVSGLIYIGDKDKLRMYVSPRYVFGRTDTKLESLFGVGGEDTFTSHSLTGSFGVQYSLHERFSVFGEAGFGVTVTERESGTSPVHSESAAFATRSAVGVTFYF